MKHTQRNNEASSFEVDIVGSSEAQDPYSSFLWGVSLYHTQMSKLFLVLFLEGSNVGRDELTSFYYENLLF